MCIPFQLHPSLFQRASQRIHLTAHPHRLTCFFQPAVKCSLDAGQSLSFAVPVSQQMHRPLFCRVVRQTGSRCDVFHILRIHLLPLAVLAGDVQQKGGPLCNPVQCSTAGSSFYLFSAILRCLCGGQHRYQVVLLGIGQRLHPAVINPAACCGDRQRIAALFGSCLLQSAAHAQ